MQRRRSPWAEVAAGCRPRASSAWPLAAALIGAASGCSALLGIDDFRDADPAANGGTAGSSSTSSEGAGAHGGTAGSGGGNSHPVVSWARSLGRSGQQNPLAVTMVDFGQGPPLGIAFAGQLQGTFDLQGPSAECPGASLALVADSGGDAFVAAIDHLGCAVWGKVFANSDEMSVTSLANTGGGLWLAGSLLGTSAIDGYPVGAGGQDVFWAELDASSLGAATSASTAPPTSLDRALVAATPSLAVVAYGSEDVNQDVLLETVAGGSTWTWSLGSSGPDVPRALVIEPVSRDILLGGEVSGGVVAAGDCHLPDADTADGFVVRLRSTSDCLWATSFGGTGDQRVTAIAASEDAVVVAGTFTETIVCDGTQETAAVGETDAFVARLALTTGTVQWCVTSGTTGNEIIGGLTLTAAGNVAVVGSFTKALGFGIDVTAPDEGSDGFVLLFDPNGLVRWHSTLRGNGDDGWVGVATSGGRIVALGFQSKNVSIDGWGGTFSPLPDGRRNIVLAAFAE